MPDEQPATASIQVDVVGTVAVRRHARILAGQELGGRRARVALVALALAGGPVPADRLAAMLWPGEPPPTWPAALRGVISGIRAALEPIGAGGERTIITTPSGYAIAPGVTSDLAAARDALRAAAELDRQGRPSAALRVAEPVTRLAGDRLLPGEDGGWLDPYRAEADAAALRARAIVATSAAALGDHHRAELEGRQAVAASPLDERAHRILIEALHHGGDRAAVVRAYEACRALLAEHLGVDPDPQTVATYLRALGETSQPGAARLPVAASAFFGREAELADVRAQIARPGLVTLSGRGGVGKSRLALQAAVRASYPGGCLWVSLASVSQDELVASTVAWSAGLPVGGDDPAALLAAHLAPLGRALLILDGCEAVVDGTASLVSTLVALCPTLTALVTSRVALAVDGERVIAVEPLPEPVQVRLLADRVRHGGGELVLDQGTAPVIAELCRRCGGLPLALELAAAQLSALSVADLLDHLPALLAGRHDQLREVAMSSYRLLGDDEAAVFRSFGVLPGPVALPLVKQVVATGAVTPVRVVRILRELTARGLLAVDRSGPRWRYYTDDDLHRLARELLDEAGETTAATERLASAVLAVLPADPRTPAGDYLEAIGEVLAPLRALLGAAIEGRLPAQAGLDLAFRLHRYWAASNVSEGRFWLSRLLAEAGPADQTGHVAYALGYLSYWSGDTAAAARELTQAVDLLAGRSDAYAARALIFLGGLADDLDEGPQAMEFVRRSIAAAAPFGVDLQVGAAMGMGCVLAERADPAAAGYAADAISRCRAGGSAEQLAATLPTAAMVCWQVGDLAAARGYIEEAMPLLAGSRRIARVVLLSAAAGVALADGDLTAAVELAGDADADATDLGIERELPLARSILARALLAAGQPGRAAAAAAAAVTASRGLTFTFPLAVCLETAALVVLAGSSGKGGAAGDGEAGLDAARLLAAAAAIRGRGDRPGPPALRAAADAARAALGPLPAGPVPDPDAAAQLALDALSRSLECRPAQVDACAPDRPG
ncbi:MAG TPA: BTAD domain-containing putative transcriptional regulator [Streptosporangiaceae bacterium]